MWIKRSDRTRLVGDDIARSEITPQRVFENRRRVLQAAGAVALGGLIGGSGEAVAAYTSPDPKAQKLAAKKRTLPRYMQRVERPWFRKGKALQKELAA